MRLIGLVLALGLTLALLAAEAQRVPEVGILVFGTESLNINVGRGAEPLREALRSFGWIDGKNITLKPRFADLSELRLAALASELVRDKVDIMVAVGTPATRAARAATGTIPIVMFGADDPVGTGFVRNLAHPEANVTGTAVLVTDVAGRRLQVLKEVIPQLTRTAVLSSATDVAQVSVGKVRTAASRLDVQVQPIIYRGLEKLPEQFAQMRAGRIQALIVIPADTIDEAREALARLALRYRLPTVSTFRQYVDAGGLMSYGPSTSAVHERTAYYVDRLLRGAKPGDLPVQESTTLELVINLKTAKALNLTIPETLLLRANKVIE
jgi:putative ABC transport system substrate-binding protein